MSTSDESTQLLFWIFDYSFWIFDYSFWQAYLTMVTLTKSWKWKQFGNLPLNLLLSAFLWDWVLNNCLETPWSRTSIEVQQNEASLLERAKFFMGAGEMIFHYYNITNIMWSHDWFWLSQKAIDSVSLPANLNLKYCFLGKWQHFFICFSHIL